MGDRPRILMVQPPGNIAQAAPAVPLAECEQIVMSRLADALARLCTEPFDGMFAVVRDGNLAAESRHLLRAEDVLNVVADGIALVGSDLRIAWANPAFEALCGGPSTGRSFYDALSCPEVIGPDYGPFHTALSGKPVQTRLHCRDNRYLELDVSPRRAVGGGEEGTLLVALLRDVTPEVKQQHRLEALHKAGNQLTALDPGRLIEMSAEARIELLKGNIRRAIRELLHYENITIRLLDRQTGRLELLLQEGIKEDAAARPLRAEQTGSGVTGYVAATGKSYLCRDITKDPLYLPGATGARSSLTVPLIYQDKVVGTFNVESPRPDAFSETDVQFAELFGREVAAALHTLELLSVEQQGAAARLVESVRREVALPVDDILNAATAVLDRYVGHDREMADKLREILAAARSIKQVIQKVGESVAPTPLPTELTCQPRQQLKGLRVLVVDNDDQVRRSAHTLLGRFGCVVETARDAQEAMAMARLGPYDLLLADIRLPDLDGYAVYRKLRELQPKAQVALMTAYGYDPTHSIVKARQEGLRHVLYKPFRIDQFLALLDAPPAAADAPAQG